MLTRRKFQFGALASGLALTAWDSVGAQPAPKRREIVDSQIHLWKADTPDRPWLPGAKAQLPEPMTIERVLPFMDRAGVDKLVIVPPILEGLRYDYGQEAARRYPGRFATMARVNLDDVGEASRIVKLLEQPHVLGVRLNIGPSQAKWLTDGTADWFWPVAEKAGIPVMFLTFGQTPLFASIAERHPGLKLIVDHMGVTDVAIKENSIPTRIAETAALAKYPNVSVKLSSAPLFSTEAYPWKDVWSHIHRLFDLYGPRRSYWGTDLTLSINKGDYRQFVTLFTDELPFLSEDDKDWVMGKGIRETLRWT